MKKDLIQSLEFSVLIAMLAGNATSQKLQAYGFSLIESIGILIGIYFIYILILKITFKKMMTKESDYPFYSTKKDRKNAVKIDYLIISLMFFISDMLNSFVLVQVSNNLAIILLLPLFSQFFYCSLRGVIFPSVGRAIGKIKMEECGVKAIISQSIFSIAFLDPIGLNDEKVSLYFSIFVASITGVDLLYLFLTGTRLIDKLLGIKYLSKKEFEIDSSSLMGGSKKSFFPFLN